MIKLKIHVSKEHMEEAKYFNGEDNKKECGIKCAIKNIFPNAKVFAKKIFIDGYEIPLPREAKEFIRGWDVSTIQLRLEMDELEFEVEVPDEVIEKINIDELKPFLVNHPTLELVN